MNRTPGSPGSYPMFGRSGGGSLEWYEILAIVLGIPGGIAFLCLCCYIGGRIDTWLRKRRDRQDEAQRAAERKQYEIDHKDEIRAERKKYWEISLRNLVITEGFLNSLQSIDREIVDEILKERAIKETNTTIDIRPPVTAT
jgi:hypothetical protein